MKTPAQDIILAPVITEASMAGIALKKYTFKAVSYTHLDVYKRQGMRMPWLPGSRGVPRFFSCA